MRRALIVLALLAGCAAPAPSPVIVARPPACAADSLRVLLDSATGRAREQRILVRLAAQQMKRYAAIVARDPSQSRFIVGWTNRAFQGVVP